MGPRKTSVVYQVQDHLLSLDKKKKESIESHKNKEIFYDYKFTGTFSISMPEKMNNDKRFPTRVFFPLYVKGRGSFLYMYISILF